MTKDTSNTRRIMLALTEANSLPVYWRAVMEHMADAPSELVTVFIRDDRWRRAASLPFTKEISRASGSSIKFTPQRAEDVDRESVQHAQQQVQRLAMESKIQLVFEILAEHETKRFHEFVRSEADLLIAPSFFEKRPFFSELAQLKCRILLIDAKDMTTDPKDDLHNRYGLAT